MSKKILLGCLQLSILINLFLYTKVYKESEKLTTALKMNNYSLEAENGFSVAPEKIYFLGRYCSIGEEFMFVKIEGKNFKQWNEVKGDFEIVQGTRPDVMGEIEIVDSFHANFKVLYAKDTSEIKTYEMELQYVAQTGKVVSYFPIKEKSLKFDLRNCY
ncbi:hypothetical protein [Halobacteriovorax sp. JY17]|uniref:hypothetical protein n=1 Tax=Halobacteriovorax sp. JY17 TaxID=2014617 RepID=UPI000C6BF1B3|nr:hypothetical protein [Halobacteriovorax sp. JY17]PIK14043.1 MAG: hypothetical protein CES88_13750 [Halobacteriovorax sp. JY17]